MMGFGALVTILALVAVVYVLGWRPQSSRPAHVEVSESALDILKARYARGEISKTEYQEMRQDLSI